MTNVHSNQNMGPGNSDQGRPFSSQTRANQISAERHDYPGGDESSDWGDDSESDGEPERDPYRASRTDRARPGTDRQTEHLSFSDILKRAPKLPSSATRAQIEHFVSQINDFKSRHRLADVEILELLGRRITESNHTKVANWWAQKNKRAPFRSWRQARNSLTETFVETTLMTNVKVFSQQGHQRRNESLREFGDRIVEAAAETDMTDRTAVHFFLGGAYDQTQVSWLKSASRPPRTIDKCISFLRRRDVDVESTPDEIGLTRSRSDQPASPKPARAPARTSSSPRTDSSPWADSLANMAMEHRRDTQQMEARLLQSIPGVVASM
ncbi:unnamed protein product, partial [Aphanomyces euteiches]